MKRIHKLFFTIITATLLITPVYAADMRSPRFQIESASVDLSEPEVTTETPSKEVPKDTETKQFDALGILIKTDGFATTSLPFTFRIKQSLLQIEDIKPGIPSTASTSLEVTGGRSVYQITVSESDLLKKLSGDTIANTRCNSENICTPYAAAVWDSVSAYGFGYSLKGTAVANDFKNDTYFRPFPNLKEGENAVTIMQSANKTTAQNSTFTIKTLVSAVQADGSYDNILNLTASPGY